MPPNAPIFADVATRLRNGPISTTEVASNLEAATIASIQRLPSTRPLDHRWDRSRGIIFSNVKRATRIDHTWTRDGEITFRSIPASKRAYAIRAIGPSSEPKPTVSQPGSYVDNAHKTPGFGASSIKQIEELKQQVDKLEKDLSQKRQEISQLRDDSKSKDGALEKRARDLAGSRRNLDDTKAALVKETEKLQRSIKQEKDTRKSLDGKIRHVETQLHTQTRRVEELERENKARGNELLAQRRTAADALDAHKQELLEERRIAAEQLQALRDSAADAIEKNAPILRAAQAEGERRANRAFERQLQELNRKHAADLKREAEQGAAVKSLQAEIGNLRSRMQNQRLQIAGDHAALRDELREEVYQVTAQLKAANEELNAQILRSDRVAAQKKVLQAALDGRKARARDDRVDYSGYRELFHDLSDQVYDILAGSNAIRDALSKESDLWRRSVTQFLGSKELLFFRQQSRYNDLKRDINNFLERRKQEAQDAAQQVRAHATEMYEARKALDLQGHATRMVTRFLHFDNESTESRGVSVSHYMSLVLPWSERLDDCDKRLDEIHAELRRLREQSAEGPPKLQDEFEMLQGHRRMLREHLQHAEAFRRREQLKALLNSSVEDRVTFVRLREMIDRMNSMNGVLNAADKEHKSPSRSLSTLRVGLKKARVHADELESFVRKRLIVQQDLEQLDQKVINEADAEIRKRISVHKREEELTMDVIVGRRTSSAKTFRERKAEQLKAVSSTNKASMSIDQLAATLGADMQSSIPITASVRLVPNVASRRVSTRMNRVALYQRALAGLKIKARKAKGNRLDQHGDKGVLLKKIEETKAKLLQAQAERSTTSSTDRPKKQTIDATKAKEEPADGSGASDTASGLNFKPSQPLQASHMQVSSKRQAQVSQWHIFSNAFVSQKQSLGQSQTASTLHAALTSQRQRTVRRSSDMNSEAGSVGVSAAMLTDQSPRRSASPQSASRTRASSTQSTSAEPAPSIAAAPASEMPSRAVSGEGDSQGGFDVSPPSSMSSYGPSDDSGSEVAEISQPEQEAKWKPEPHTLLDYQIPHKAYRDAVMASPSSNAAYWSHQLYKSLEGKTPIVYYCRNLETAERQCRLFLGEPVVGFDLEWEIGSSPGKGSIKRAVSLIQLAAEDKICLVHVACFAGDKIEQLLPPSLKTILEDENVAKAGVNIAGDATRMRSCFGVIMKGVFELSHMYRLVKTPEQVSFKLVSMATQVQNTLLLPLKKDEVRTSAWSKSLNMQQCTYAAADAYAGFRLFYQLDNLRKDMRPTPPRPPFQETFKPIILGDGTEVTRAAYRAKSTGKKPVAAGEQDESDDEFFDALEELPDTYGQDGDATSDSRVSVSKSVKDGEVDIDEADPDSVAALNEVMANTTLANSSGAVPAGRSNADKQVRDSKVDLDEIDADSVAALGDMMAQTTLEDPLPNTSTQKSRTSDTDKDSTQGMKQIQTHQSAKSPKQAPHVLVASPETILAAMWVSSLPSRSPKVGAASLRAYHLWHHQNHNLEAVAGICRQPPLAMTSVASYIMTAIKEEDMPYQKDRLREVFQHLPKSVWHVYGKWVRELGLDK
ncbi:Putative 3'-5' exonuclease domain, ribonuclease H-like superfamily [Septoria linicola]|uniref:3'-5' exonuclease domain, ribonuclease H-like superfamily n=1 Tax=Septoria linicola TaxID=215465 RepID=A0A9Q9B6Z3_9PEZI|nr:putative 3'-5' exonuclease domain, ribonuclease H-like superfamily [Septoria linicola]USW57491.1 Putative 3'-5' exonuclease domain, ribonuclease H-like superfamily [Septoria linicola]